jgi:arabinan endo-1,5-alpha-L-arabinosidase
MKNISLLLFVFCISITVAYAQQSVVSGADQNRPMRKPPVIGEISSTPGVHDPAMAKEGDTYYVYYTGSGCWSSKDLITWKRERPVFDSSNTPEWLKTAGFARPGYWAPDISFFNGQWYLYYPVSAFGKNTSVIGVATNKTLNPSSPDYKWVDQGKVVQTYPGKTNWNAIDPNVIIDKKTGDPWLVYGSFWHGIQLVKLQKDGIRLANPDDSLTEHTVASRKAYQSGINPASTEDHPVSAGGNAIEAPFIFYKSKYYYLFVSYDYCCKGPKSNYKIAVGRSKKITGPYVDKNDKKMSEGGGSILLEGDGKEFYGLGHNGTYTFDNTDYLVYHGYSVAQNAASKLVIEKLTWDSDGWPVIGDRVTPTVQP